MEQNLGLEPYTEEEKKKIEERLNKPEERSYGRDLITLIVISFIFRIIYVATIGSIASHPYLWIFALLVNFGLAIGILCFWVLWIGDMIRRRRKAKNEK